MTSQAPNAMFTNRMARPTSAMAITVTHTTSAPTRVLLSAAPPLVARTDGAVISQRPIAVLASNVGGTVMPRVDALAAAGMRTGARG